VIVLLARPRVRTIGASGGKYSRNGDRSTPSVVSVAIRWIGWSRNWRSSTDSGAPAVTERPTADPSARRVETLCASIEICSELQVRGSGSARSSRVMVPPLSAKRSTATSSGRIGVPGRSMRSEKLNVPPGSRTTRTVEPSTTSSRIRM
jgi:hypothetical protein